MRGHPEDRERALELGAAGRGEGSPLPRSGLRVGRFAAGGGHADDPVPGVGELGQQPTREVGLVVGVRPDPEDGAEGRDGAHDRIVACDRCHRPVIGDGTGGHAATVPRRAPTRIVVPDGRHPGAHDERNTHDHASSRPRSRPRPGRGVRLQGRRRTPLAYNARPRLPRRPARPLAALASVDSATSEELAERSGLAERYVREWLSAQAAAGYVTYDAGDQGSFTLPAEHAMVLADDDSPASGTGDLRGHHRRLRSRRDRLANAYATGEGVGWHEHDPRLFTGVDRFYQRLLPQLAAHRVDAVGRRAGRAARGGHPRRRRRLRPRRRRPS